MSTYDGHRHRTPNSGARSLSLGNVSTEGPSPGQDRSRGKNSPVITRGHSGKTCGRKVARVNNGREELRLSFLFGPKRQASKCAYQLLSKKDQEFVQTVFDEFEVIINLAIKDNKEMNYWKKIASKVVSNAGILIDR